MPAIKAGLKEGGMDLTTEQTHEVLKFRFLKRDVPVGSDGEFVTVVESTSALDVMEFVEYTDRCIQFAAEYFGCGDPAARRAGRDGAGGIDDWPTAADADVH